MMGLIQGHGGQSGHTLRGGNAQSTLEDTEGSLTGGGLSSSPLHPWSPWDSARRQNLRWSQDKESWEVRQAPNGCKGSGCLGQHNLNGKVIPGTPLSCTPKCSPCKVGTPGMPSRQTMPPSWSAQTPCTGSPLHLPQPARTDNWSPHTGCLWVATPQFSKILIQVPTAPVSGPQSLPPPTMTFLVSE